MANSQTITINVKAIADMKDVLSNVNSIQQALSKMKLPANLKSSFSETFKGLEKEITKYQELLNKKNPTKGDLSGLEKSGNKIIKLYDDIINKLNSIDDKTLKAAFKDLGTEEVEKLKNQISDLQNKFSDIAKNSDFTKGLKTGFADLKKEIGNANKDVTDFVNKLSKATFSTFFKNLESGKFDLAGKNLESIKQQVDALNDSAEKQKLQEWVRSLEQGFNELKSNNHIEDLTSQLEKLKSELSGAKADFVQQLIDGFKNGAIVIGNTSQSLEELINRLNGGVEAQISLNNELSQVKSRIQYFFGLSNAVNLFKRAVRGAFETIKELDKAMTETAVVTDFTVGDMWSQLPRYTAAANELGVTTKGAYETMTLFYQQGLDTNQAFALGTETMKMARIAGLDYADATDAMTAALRGFNMELTETSAKRVNDVYSQLAAKTASNVEEISTAMTKTASIANNAGMEFETTAAYLSQIIETTREAPETAGTALKTVIARFTELKKPLDQIQEVEGEVVDANKIETALKSVGVALRDSTGQFRNLDDVFLDLNAKWSTLTTNQQRYVATMAAGSRQQSRFIAMMSDYSRTQELIGEAYNSSGASQKQYEKTLESLESKLNKLKNAWNEFLMGLTNSNVVKAGVDILTNLLNLVNKITGAFGDGVGSILKWATAIGAIFAGRYVLSNKGPLAKLLTGTLAGNALGLGKTITRTITDEIGNEVKETVTETIERSGIGLSGVLKDVGKGIWGGLGGIGGALGLEGAAASLAGLGTVLGGVAVAALAVVSAYKLWETYTPEGQLKVAQQISDALNNAAANAEKAADALKDLSNSYQEYTDAIDKATTMAEKEEAITSRNKYLNSLIQENEEYSKYLSSKIENGQLVISIDEDKLADSITQAELATTRAAASASFGQALVAQRQAEVYQGLLDRNNVIVENGQVAGIRDIADTVTGETYIREATEKEVALYTNYMELAQESTDSAIQQAVNGYLNYLQGSDLADNTVNSIAQVLGKQFDSDSFAKAVGGNFNVFSKDAYEKGLQEELRAAGENKWTSFSPTGFTKSELSYLYTVRYGAAPESGMSNADILTAIKSFDYEGQLETIANGIESLVKTDEDSYAKIFAGIAGEDLGVNLLSANLSDSLDTTLGLSIGELNETLGKIGYQLGIIDPNELKQYVYDRRKDIEQNVKLQQQQQAQRLVNTAQQMNYLGLGRQIGQFFKVGVSNLDWATEFQSIITSFAESGFADEIGKIMLDSMSSQDWENSDLQRWIYSLDFSNPITALQQLEKSVNSNDVSVSKLAKDILNSQDAATAFSKSNQVQYFLTSQAFTDMSEQLSDFMDENGRITSDNIKELASSSKELDELLKRGTVTAAGLARALTGIQNGELAVTDLNDAILAAVNSMDTLDEMAKETIDDLNNFEPSFDENDIASFISKVSEFVDEQISKGAYGNNAMREYLLKIFGPDAFTGAEYGDAYVSKLQQYAGFLRANKDNMLSAWRGIIKDYDEGVKVYQQDGEIVLETAGHTTDELVSILQRGTGYSEELIRMMLTDYKNYSDDLWYELAQNDLPTALKKWAAELGTTANGELVYTEEEFMALAGALQVGTDAVSNGIDALIKEGYNFKKVSFDLSSLSAISSTLRQLGADTNALIQETGDIPTFDLAGIKEAFDLSGIEYSFEEVINNLAADYQSFVMTVNGEEIEVSIDEDKTAYDAVQQKLDELDDKDLKAALGLETEDAETSLETILGTINSSSATVTVNGYTQPLRNAVDAARRTIASTPIVVTVTANTTAATKSLTGLTKTYKTSSGAKGGKVGSFASGTNHLYPGTALTGEEEPEIIWNKEQGYAYITGQNGPEFQNLQPGDRVFNGAETRKILKNSKKNLMGSFATGYGGVKSSSGSSSSSGGGGSSGVSEDTWRNEMDWLYNLVEDIAELERIQAKYEEKYEDYLKDDTKTGKDLYRLLIDQLANLNAQLDANTLLLEKREQEMREFMQDTNNYKDYLWFNWEDRTLEIDWDKINAISDQDTYKAISDSVSRAEDIQDKMDSAEDAIMSTRNAIQDLKDIWRDTYLSFEKRVVDALVKEQQSVIDGYSELNDTINDTNNRLLDSLQEQISLQRQIRDNTKAEDEIADLEARIAYLRRDTTGGNAATIAELEKQLQEKRENYSDNLIDQSIDRLKDESDKATDQREQQISIMQAQLDYQIKIGAFNEKMLQLINDARQPDGSFNQDSELYKLLQGQENWAGMTQEQQNAWTEDLLETFKQVEAYLNVNEDQTFAQQVADATKNLNQNVYTYYSQGNSNLIPPSGSSGGGGGGGSGGGYSGGYEPLIYESPGTSTGAISTNQDAKQAQKETQSIKQQQSAKWTGYRYDPYSATQHKKYSVYSDGTTQYIGLTNHSFSGHRCTDCGYTQTAYYKYTNSQGKTISGLTKTEAQNRYNNEYNSIMKDTTLKKADRVAKTKNMKEPSFDYYYKYGGLANFTGPAWLDGTFTKPEAVLNAVQTQAFLKLADVLPAVINKAAGASPFTNNINLNLVMNVDEIGSDYDVDRIADRVKDIIYNAGSYRNVTTLNFTR